MTATHRISYDLAHYIDEQAEHIQDHHAYKDTGGYIVLATKQPYWKQWAYKLEELDIIPAEFTGQDAYFSMNTFYRTQRRIEYLRQLKALYVDIDFYNAEKYKGTHVHSAYIEGAVMQELQDHNIPEPNRIIFSGRGLILVWYIEPVPHMALPRWQGVQDHLFKILEPYGADQKAKDCTRVFRMAGTINSKNGQAVIVKKIHDHRYDLEELAKEFFGEKEERTKRTKGIKEKKVTIMARERTFNARTLAIARINDIKTLLELRDYNVRGYRETICFLYRMHIAHFIFDPATALEMTLELNASFTEPLSEKEVIQATASGERKAYRYSNKRIIELLDITEEEQRYMQTLIGPNESKRRDRERKKAQRRAEGAQERDKYLEGQKQATAAKIERLKAILEQNPNIKKAELAKQLGIGRTRLYELLKQII